MAGDIGKIDDFCRCLAEQWKRVPDWKFSRLVVKVAGDIYKNEHRDIFLAEDEEMAVMIRDSVDRLVREKAVSENI